MVFRRHSFISRVKLDERFYLQDSEEEMSLEKKEKKVVLVEGKIETVWC